MTAITDDEFDELKSIFEARLGKMAEELMQRVTKNDYAAPFQCRCCWPEEEDNHRIDSGVVSMGHEWERYTRGAHGVSHGATAYIEQ